MSDLSNFGFVLPHWFYWGWLAVMPLLMMAWDRWSSSRGVQAIDKNALANEKLQQIEAEMSKTIESDYANWFTRIIDWISEKSGVFISFWTVNAVVFYFFEVVMRYIFNMPTIWVHEASFLLFGMQYLLAGAFALLHGAHVRVDVIYNLLPVRGRIGMDIFIAIGLRRKEKIPVPDGLYQNKGSIQNQTNNRYENQLRRTILGSGPAGRIIRQDKGQHHYGSKGNQ